jgi:iron complex outermembrane recepter protein
MGCQTDGHIIGLLCGRLPPRIRWLLPLIVGTCAALYGIPAWSETAAGPRDDLARLSLQDLANLEVTSVSKGSEALERAAASIYVITHENIMRSGVTSLMEALRLAPNIRITQVSATSYIISARGISGNAVAQNFSNKLLMLIDGRSVYTPLFSGIYSDAQDVMLEDIDRIEVISGPGATLWGANAMNGVINVITRPSYLTQGSSVSVAAGNQEQDLNARYGSRMNGELSYRLYGLGFHRAAEAQPDGTSAHDGWIKEQGGFRSDWSTDRNSLTLQGDVYRALEQQFMSADGSIAGANVVARYQHHTERSELQVQAYFDQTQRFGPGGTGGGGFVLHTYDLQLQQSIRAGSHQIVWGGGERLNSYAITNQQSLLFEPPKRNLTLGDLFAQDTMSLGRGVRLTAGIKFEDDPYSGWTPLPDARVSWSLTDRATLWAAASKAIRSPTPFDVDVVERFGPILALAGNKAFRPEQVLTYETGTRIEAVSSLSFSLTAFYNDYDNLRTVEPASNTQFFPLSWQNLIKGDTFGIEGWANWQVMDWWRLSPGFRALREHLRFKPGAIEILGTTQAGDDPSTQANLASSLDLGHHFVVDATLRYVGALPNPSLPHYCQLNGRIGWRASSSLDLSLNGLNLLRARHYELPPALGGEGIYRSVQAEARWRF